MRNALFAAILLFSAGSALAVCAPAIMMPDTPGDSTCPETRDQIEFITVERAQLNSFTITKKLDKASPNLFKACANGKHFPTATITRPAQYIKYVFTDVIVSSYSHTANPVATETLTLTFAKAEAVSTAATERSLTPTRATTALLVPATFSIAGSVAPQPVAIKFMGQPATGFRMVVQNGPGQTPTVMAYLVGGVTPTAAMLSRDGTTLQQGSAELRNPDGTALVKYLFDAGFAGDGILTIMKIEVTFPSITGPGAPPVGWNLNSNIAV